MYDRVYDRHHQASKVNEPADQVKEKTGGGPVLVFGHVLTLQEFDFIVFVTTDREAQRFESEPDQPFCTRRRYQFRSFNNKTDEIFIKSSKIEKMKIVLWNNHKPIAEVGRAQRSVAREHHIFEPSAIGQIFIQKRQNVIALASSQ